MIGKRISTPGMRLIGIVTLIREYNIASLLKLIIHTYITLCTHTPVEKCVTHVLAKINGSQSFGPCGAMEITDVLERKVKHIENCCLPCAIY